MMILFTCLLMAQQLSIKLFFSPSDSPLRKRTSIEAGGYNVTDCDQTKRKAPGVSLQSVSD